MKGVSTRHISVSDAHLLLRLDGGADADWNIGRVG
jgi:hypothetical protein